MQTLCSQSASSPNVGLRFRVGGIGASKPNPTRPLSLQGVRPLKHEPAVIIYCPAYRTTYRGSDVYNDDLQYVRTSVRNVRCRDWPPALCTCALALAIMCL